MNEITRWFESMGVPPLLGGIVIGAIIVFLLTRRSDRNVKPLGAETGLPNVEQKILKQNMVTGAFAQIRIENNGQPFELSPEVSSEILDLLRNGNKIGAIKALRESTGFGLAEAKSLVEVMERSGIRG